MQKKILYVLSALFGLLLLNGGLDKYLHYMPVPPNLPEALMKDNAAFMEISWLMPLVGAAEILAGLLIIFPKTRALGAIVAFPVILGVLLVHLTVAPESLPIAAVIWLILGWIIYDNRKKYLPMVGQ
jgi:putative oxidoreductase